MRTCKLATMAAVTMGVMIAGQVLAHDEHEHGASPSGSVTVTGEVVDLACYLDHHALGQKHAACATKCIAAGLPVGLKAQDGKLYLLIGEHKPLNEQLAPLAAKTVTVRGKLASRDGVNMIEDAEIVPAGAAAVQYTCPMHPEVVQDKPGKCPQCGMNLEVKK